MHVLNLIEIKQMRIRLTAVSTYCAHRAARITPPPYRK